MVISRSPRILIGIDIGLSNLKVAAFSERGRLIARGSRPYHRLHPLPDHSEEDPEQWITLIAEIVQQFLRDGVFHPHQVTGLSLSGRGSGAVFVDRQGQVLFPHWLDNRHHPQARRLRERFGHYADNRALASKTLYLAEQHPDLFARLWHPLFVKDFVLYRLTGEIATDPSSGPIGYSWPQPVWDMIGVPIEQVPPVRPHTAIGGVLLPGPASMLGLPAGLPVAIGGHDGACANTGAGAIADGQVCLTLGTNGVARSITSRPAQTEPWLGISAYHFLPDLWCCGGDAGLLGHAPSWLARLFDAEHASLGAAARHEPVGANGLTFLPFLHGQISPEKRPDRRAAFLGLGEGVNQAQLYRAVLEGTSCLIRLIADRLGAYGLGTGEWRVSGGGANSDLWLEIIAAMLGRPLLVSEHEEGTRGACMFLAVALGWYASVEGCATEWVRTVRTVEPDPALGPAYAPVIARFRILSEAVHQAEQESLAVPGVISIS